MMQNHLQDSVLSNFLAGCRSWAPVGRALLLIVCTMALLFSPTQSHAALTCQDLLSSQILEVMQTKYGPVVLTEPDAIQFHRDVMKLAQIMRLPNQLRIQALKEYAAQSVKPKSQIALVFVNYAMALWIGAQIAVGVHADPSSIPALFAVTPPSLFAADFGSAGLHRFLDAFANESNPIWGSAARAFRRHHDYASNLNDLSYLQNIAPFGPLMLPFFIGLSVAAPHLDAAANFSGLTMLLLFLNGSEFHRQAHLTKSERNPLFDKLQTLKLSLTPGAHGKHHRGSQDSDFGIINGWSNRSTNRFWKALDKVAWRAFKKMPGNWIQHPETIPPKVLEELRTGFATLGNDIPNLPQTLLVSLATQPELAMQNADLDQILQIWVQKLNSVDDSDPDSDGEEI